MTQKEKKKLPQIGDIITYINLNYWTTHLVSKAWNVVFTSHRISQEVTLEKLLAKHGKFSFRQLQFI